MTFKEWLDAHPYMTAALRNELGVSRSAISQARLGKMPIPVRWNAAIEKLSFGKIKAKHLASLRIERMRGA
jgi:DNA-binding transcriptional regulator YdaS (Cro superfamily)